MLCDRAKWSASIFCSALLFISMDSMVREGPGVGVALRTPLSVVGDGVGEDEAGGPARGDLGKRSGVLGDKYELDGGIPVTKLVLEGVVGILGLG